MMKELYAITGKPNLYRTPRGWCCHSANVGHLAKAATKEGAYIRWLNWVIKYESRKITKIAGQVLLYRSQLYSDYFYKGIML